MKAEEKLYLQYTHVQRKFHGKNICIQKLIASKYHG